MYVHSSLLQGPENKNTAIDKQEEMMRKANRAKHKNAITYRPTDWDGLSVNSNWVLTITC